MGNEIDAKSEREQREFERDQLEKSMSLKDGILDSALDCVITIDQASRIIEFNPAAEKTFGYKRGQVVGKPLMETIIPPSLCEAHKAEVVHYLKTGQGPVLGKRIEITGMRSDGSEFPVELVIKPFLLDNTTFFAAYIRDITQRQKADEELKDSESKANALLEYSPGGILAVNTSGSIVFVNSMVEKLFGYLREELLHQKVEILVPERYRAAHIAHRGMFMENLEVRPMALGRELKGRHKDGREFDIEVGELHKDMS